MWDQLIEGRPRLDVEVPADHHFERRLVRTIQLELVRPVIRQPPVGVRQQAHQVKQGRDVRVRLAVVVAEQTFVISREAREGRRRQIIHLR